MGLWGRAHTQQCKAVRAQEQPAATAKPAAAKRNRKTCLGLLGSEISSGALARDTPSSVHVMGCDGRHFVTFCRSDDFYVVLRASFDSWCNHVLGWVAFAVAEAANLLRLNNTALITNPTSPSPTTLRTYGVCEQEQGVVCWLFFCAFALSHPLSTVCIKKTTYAGTALNIHRNQKQSGEVETKICLRPASWAPNIKT